MFGSRRWVGLILVWGLLVRADPPLSVNAYDLSFSSFYEFATWLHEAIDSGDPRAGFLDQIKEKLNVFELGRNIRRAGNLLPTRVAHGTFDPRDQFKNLVFLLAGSHLTETLSSGVYYTIGKINGVPDDILLPVSGALATMILPGVADWGCWMVLGTFVGSEEAREVASKIRIYTIMAGKKAGGFVGLNQLVNKLIKEKPARQRLSEIVTNDSIEASRRSILFLSGQNELAHEFVVASPHGEPLLKLQVDIVGGDRVTLRWVQVFESVGRGPGNETGRREIRTLRKHLARVLWTFGGDIRQAVLSVWDAAMSGDIDRVVYSPFVAGAEIWRAAESAPVLREKYRRAGALDGDGQPPDPSRIFENSNAYSIIERHFDSKASSVAPGQTKVWFVDRAVQLYSAYRLDPIAAISSLPSIVSDRAVNCTEKACSGFRATKDGFFWLMDHKGHIVYTPVRAAGVATRLAVKTGFTLSRIALQMVSSLGQAGIFFFHRMENGFDWASEQVAGRFHRCAEWFVGDRDRARR